MNLTDEQHAICQAARDLDVGSSLKIQAFAGTGKTTTLAAIAESLPELLIRTTGVWLLKPRKL